MIKSPFYWVKGGNWYDAISGDLRPSDQWFNRYKIFIYRLNRRSSDQLALLIRSKVELVSDAFL